MKALAFLVSILLAPLNLARGAFAFQASDPPPHPLVSILSPTDGHATNSTTLEVQVAFEASTSPGANGARNVRDVDLLLNGSLLETFTNPAAIKQGTHTFVVDISTFDAVTVEFVAHAYQGNRSAGLRGESAAVRVSIDRTPPDINVVWPPQTRFGTDRTDIEISGSASDAFPGLDQLSLTTPSGSIPLSHPGFSSAQPLNTDTTPADPVSENFFTLIATDFAGNVATVRLQVDFTLESTTILVKPAESEPLGNLHASINQAFVVFDPGVDRDLVHGTIESYGGRVVGFLAALHVALAVFPDVHTVADLQVLLSALRSAAGVLGTQLTGLIPAGQLDNELLSAQARIAYDDINAIEAVSWINANAVGSVPIRPVRIAIIDSGLALTFGRNNELGTVAFFDATQSGNGPQDPTPHGTQVAGIIAGANNGEGNNGIVQGISGGNFDVVLFGAANPNSPQFIDGNAYALARDTIVRDGFDVVNMSFGSQFPNAIDHFSAIDRRALAETPRTLWVAAAGNGGEDEIGDDIGCSDMVPAVLSCEFGNVVSVAAHDPSSDNISTFSNFGDGVQVSAPGESVLTAFGVGNYSGFAGTSAATPMVTGTAALLHALADLSGSEVRALLEITARDLPGSPHDGIDALRAVMLGLAAGTMHEVSGQGVGDDHAMIPGGVWPQGPGLAGFGFDFFDNGGDHHLDEIEASVLIDRVEVAYNDKNDDDPFSWRVEGISLPSGTAFGSISGSSSGGSALSDVLAVNGVLVLTGFRLDFSDEDHHIDQVGVEFVYEGGGTQARARVRFNDKNDDDAFTYRVDYAVIPSDRVVDMDRTPLRGPVRGEDSYDIGAAGLPVLAGFFADYGSDDHHIDIVSFDIDVDGEVRAAFNDKNDDDTFSWYVDWVLFE